MHHWFSKQLNARSWIYRLIRARIQRRRETLKQVSRILPCAIFYTRRGRRDQLQLVKLIQIATQRQTETIFDGQSDSLRVFIDLYLLYYFYHKKNIHAVVIRRVLKLGYCCACAYDLQWILVWYRIQLSVWKPVENRKQNEKVILSAEFGSACAGVTQTRWRRDKNSSRRTRASLISSRGATTRDYWHVRRGVCVCMCAQARNHLVAWFLYTPSRRPPTMTTDERC